MTLHSNYRPLAFVHLPQPRDRQFYMHTFDLSRPTVPEGFEDYLTSIEELLDAAGARKGVAHLTVDEKIVKAGMSQRKPKPHVDGCFDPIVKHWGHEGGGGGWLHGCNNISGDTLKRMPVIVAASAAGCKVYKGVFEGEPKSDGDLSHIADQLGKGKIVAPYLGCLLSADCVHESMVFEKDTPRTFIRIALPNDINYGF